MKIREGRVIQILDETSGIFVGTYFEALGVWSSSRWTDDQFTPVPSATRGQRSEAAIRSGPPA